MSRIVAHFARPRVALLIESSRAYGRGTLAGVAKYIRDHGHWSVFLQEHFLCDELPSWFDAWDGDGIITRIENAAVANVIKRLAIPTVYVRNVPPHLKVPSVVADNAAISRAAFEHLRDRGFRHFAFCGFNGADYSEERRDSFEKSVTRAGLHCHVFGMGHPDAGLNTAQYEAEGLEDRQRVARWLGGLPKPVGLMACNDMRGQQILDACRRVGIAVPDDVAVVGVDNESVFCDLSDPPLSSVMPNAERVGYEAAAMLDRMMTGKKVRMEPSLIEPAGVVARRSTEVLAIDDRRVAAAVRFIREHACEGIDVGDVVRAVPMSRSTLERRYARIMGHSPKQEILQTRLQRAPATSRRN